MEWPHRGAQGAKARGRADAILDPGSGTEPFSVEKHSPEWRPGGLQGSRPGCSPGMDF